MVEWLSQFTAHALHVIGQGNAEDLAAVFLVVALIEFGIPFPLVLDSLLFLLGYQITSLWFKTILVILVLLVGREVGSSGVYWLSHSLGHPLLQWLGKRFPRLTQRLNRLIRTVKTKSPFSIVLARLGAKTPLAASVTTLGFNAPLTITLARLTPGLLSATSCVSGALGFRYKYFVIGVGIGSLLSDVVSIALGIITGYGLRQFNLAPSSGLVLLGVVADIIMILTIQYWLRRRTSQLVSRT